MHWIHCLVWFSSEFSIFSFLWVDTRKHDSFSYDYLPDISKITFSGLFFFYYYFRNNTPLNVTWNVICHWRNQRPFERQSTKSQDSKSVKTSTPLSCLPVWLDFYQANFSNKHSGVHFHRCHSGQGCMELPVPLTCGDQVRDQMSRQLWQIPNCDTVSAFVDFGSK